MNRWIDDVFCSLIVTARRKLQWCFECLSLSIAHVHYFLLYSFYDFIYKVNGYFLSEQYMFINIYLPNLALSCDVIGIFTLVLEFGGLTQCNHMAPQAEVV